MPTLLRPSEIERLRGAPLTYGCVAGTATGEIDAGYRVFTRSTQVSGLSFHRAVERLMTWGVQEGAGLRVSASSPRVEQHGVVLMRLGLGPVALRIPCRVVHVIQEPDRVGFAYGTLPGHPESGEEQFVLEQNGNEVEFTVHAFSRSSSRLAKLSGPLGHHFQSFMTDRYLRTMTR